MPGLYTTLYTKVLMYTAANSRNGLRPVFRDDYLRNMRKIMGPSVKWLEVLEILEELERDGEVWIEHLGSEDFKVWLTEKSLQRFRHTTLPPRDVRGAPTSSGPTVEVAPPIKDNSTPGSTSDDAPKVDPETSTSVNPAVVEDHGPQSRRDPPMTSTDLANNPETSPRVSPTEDLDKAIIEQHLRELEETQLAIARREKALNDRLVRMVEHERELIRREEEFEEIRKSLEEGLAKRQAEVDQLADELRSRLSKSEAQRNGVEAPTTYPPERLAALEAHEDDLLRSARALQATIEEQERAIAVQQERHKRLREAIERTHAELEEHVINHRRSRKE
jgi:hypothetical protein